jgi:hypothetical protein
VWQPAVVVVNRWLSEQHGLQQSGNGRHPQREVDRGDNALGESDTGFSIELRRGPFEVLMDGRPVGTVNHEQIVEITIDPRHQP